MNELALFAGAGGGLLASSLLGWKTVCAVENAPGCLKILTTRQDDGSLDLFPIWDDIRSFQGKPWRGLVDIITGGFPCQAFSTAAHGDNIRTKDLWPQMARVIREVRSPLVFAENVSIKAISKAAKDCSHCGYYTQTLALSAEDVGADHRRQRYWLLAYADNGRELLSTFYVPTSRMRELYPSIWSTAPQGWSKESVKERHGIYSKESQKTKCGSEVMALERRRNSPPESNRSRMVNGVASWVDRYRAIGNGQVPAVAATAFCILASEVLKDLEKNLHN